LEREDFKEDNDISQSQVYDEGDRGYFNIGEPAVSQASQGFKEIIDNDRVPRGKIREIREKLNPPNV